MLNLTPHAIVILNKDQEEVISFPPSGTVARVSTSEKEVGVWRHEGDHIPIMVKQIGKVVDVPLSEEGVQFLVSAMVLAELGSEYHNIAFAPDTGATAIRNVGGYILGVTRLCTVPNK